MRRLVVLGATLAILGLAGPPAAAHTDLVSSDPADGSTVERIPRRITLTFNEAMDPRLAAVTVAIAGGATTLADVTSGDDPTVLVARVGTAVELRGAARVSFRVTSADGHPVQGTFMFRVDQPKASSPTPDPSSTDPDVRNPDPGVTADAQTPDDPADGSDDGISTGVLLAGASGGLILIAGLVVLVARYLRVGDT